VYVCVCLSCKSPPMNSLGLVYIKLGVFSIYIYRERERERERDRDRDRGERERQDP
jgi:hypothetical protein